MTRPERSEAEWVSHWRHDPYLLAIAGFGYGVSAFSYAPFVTLFVWVLSVAILYIGWALAVDGLVLAVRIALADGPYSQ